ncbi:MAG: DinB family protein [Cyclobacteriaceae bacterium]
MNNLNLSALQLLDQLKLVIGQLSSEQYRAPINILSNASIGQHLRHTLEFFICLFDAKNEGKLNYDNRKRDQYIEQDKDFALSIVQSIKELLQKEDNDFPLLLEACYDQNQSELTIIKTNYNREIAYNIEHTIHHMALIKIGIRSVAEKVVLPENFGVAISTIRHNQNS